MWSDMIVLIRLAELWAIMKERELTASEKKEFDQCLEWNYHTQLKLSEINAKLMVAVAAGDMAWEVELLTRKALIYENMP
jgi:hypothetical protein